MEIFGIFTLKMGTFPLKWQISHKPKKSKKGSKNRVFEFLDLKYGFSFSRVYFQSDRSYSKFISPKTKKLGRFFAKIIDLSSNLMISWKKRKIVLKVVFLSFFNTNMDFFFIRVYFQWLAAGIRLISSKSKKLGRFVVKNGQFGLKFGVFVKKSKNRYKNHILKLLRLNWGSFCSK